MSLTYRLLQQKQREKRESEGSARRAREEKCLYKIYLIACLTTITSHRRW